MITQQELENLGFVLLGVFDTITRYRFRIDRTDLWKSDTYTDYFYEEDSSPTGIPQRLYGILHRGTDYVQPTYELLKTWSTIEALEVDLKIYLKKDLTN